MSEKLNMDEKITIFNIAPWNVAFPNLTTHGGTSIQPNARTRIRREEVIEQVSAGNKLLAGLDEYGSHATIIIEDEETRKYLEFDSEDGKRTQNVITKDKVAQWFELKTDNAFEKKIRENVKTRAEKQYLLKVIKDLKIDAHSKIAFCQEYCKFSLRGI